MLKIRILKDVPYLGIKKGEVYDAKSYNVYRSEVEIVNET